MKAKKLLFKLLAVVCVIAMILPANIPAEAKAALSKKSATIVEGNTLKLSVTGTKSKVTWSTGSSKIAKVSSSGVVTAVKAGSTTVTAKVDGSKYTCKVKVTKAKLNESKLTMKVNDKETLKFTNSKGSVSWSSSNKKVAEVSKKGVVTAKDAGTAVITAKIGGSSYKCKVQVSHTDVEVKSMTLTANGGGVAVAGESGEKISIVMQEDATQAVVSVLDMYNDVVFKKALTNLKANKEYSVVWEPSASQEAGHYYVTVKAGDIIFEPDENDIINKFDLYKQEFEDGQGSESNPFLVKTYAQLKKISNYPDCFFKQIADIDGEYDTFAGAFDLHSALKGGYNGNGFKISNLMISENNKNDIALFCFVDKDAVVENVSLSNVYTTTLSRGAVLVNKNAGTVKNCKIENSAVNTSKADADSNIAILVAENTLDGMIKDCTINDSTLTAIIGWQHNWAGGLCANNAGSIMNSTLTNVTMKTSVTYGWNHSGGIVSNNSGKVINCTMTKCSQAFSSKNCNWTGVIAGDNNGTMIGCTETDTITDIDATRLVSGNKGTFQ
ncbi:MAG: Ig-like domain-containing protein [Lachnospiraceae bacterium]|nr:Ig-like domain-containing protein [Lachnospiraceae bacterium]